MRSNQYSSEEQETGNGSEVDCITEEPEFTIDEERRLILFTGGIFGNFVSSMTYLLSIVGHQIKSYGLSQSELTTISSVAKILAFGSFFFGLAFDYAGPVPLFIWSSVLIVAGTVLMGLTFDGYIEHHTWLFVIYFTMITMAAAPADIAALLTANLNFPRNRGDVICCAKITAALGSSFMSLFYATMFQGNYAHFMYFSGALNFVMCIYSLFTMRLPPYIIPGFLKSRLSKEEIARRRATQIVYDSTPAPFGNIIAGHGVVITSLLFLTAATLLVSLQPLTSTIKYVLAGIAFGLLFANFLLIVPPRIYKRLGLLLPECSFGNGEPADKPGSVAIIRGIKQRIPLVSPSYQTGFWRDLLTLRLWAFFWFSFTTLGIGFTISFNSPQLYSALTRFSDVGNARNAALIGIGSSVGRYLFGITEGMFMRRRGYWRYFVGILCPVSPVIMAISFILFLTLKGETSTVSWVFYSFGFGMAWGVVPIMSTMMYTTYSGKVYLLMFLGVSSSLAVVNKGIFGTLYDKGMKGKDPDSKCYECVRDTLIICGCLCLSGAAAAVYMFYDYRKLVLKQLLLTDEEYEDALAAQNSENIKFSPNTNSTFDSNKQTNEGDKKTNG